LLGFFRMRRRHLLQSVLASPALAAQTTQHPLPQPGPVPREDTDVALTSSAPEAAAETDASGTTLAHLVHLLVPAFGGRPGAREAGVASFLAHYIAQSKVPTRRRWAAGLAQLETAARAKHAKAFAALSAEEAAPFLAPLSKPLPYPGSKDPQTRFLFEARQLALRLTINSREWAQSLQGRQRSGAGQGTYWTLVD
jgi:hypothetical protein